MPQVTEEFSPGTYPLSIPAEATNIVGEAIGSGAPGSPGNSSMCGAGGAGGWYVRRDLSWLAGQTVQVVVPVDGSATTINAGGGIDIYAPGGSSPSGVNLPGVGNGYSIANAGGAGGTDRGAAGTGGQPGSESIGGLSGVDGGGVSEGPGADATVRGAGGDGGGLDSAGGLGGPGWARVTYDMPDPVEPPPVDPPIDPPAHAPLSFVATPQDTLIVRRGPEVIRGDALGVVVDTLNGLGLGA